MTTKVTNIYNLKLTPSQFGQNSIVVNCSQYDSLFRVIQFNLFNGNAVYSIPEGSVVTIRGTKKDNTGFEYECDYSNNVVTFPLQQQITIFPGKVPAELRITSNEEIIGSWNFLFLVEESPLSDETTISETQLPLLEQAIEAADRLNEAFDDITEFTDETYPNAVQNIQNEGATQVANVTNEGTTQRGLVSSEGATQIASIQAEGTTQKGLVTSEGTTQVANVQAKGTEVLDSIPSDYTELSGDVADLNSALNSLELGIDEDDGLLYLYVNGVKHGEGVDVSGGGSGLTADIKTALLQIAQKVAYIDEHGQDYYDDLYDALYSVAVVRIGAVYTQTQAVYPATALDDLKTDLVVTAYYEDSTSAVVTNYTLSGTLAVGTSTVTVTYKEFTTTFNVTVSTAPIAPYYELPEAVTFTGSNVFKTGVKLNSLIADGAASMFIDFSDTGATGVSDGRVAWNIGTYASSYTGVHISGGSSNNGLYNFIPITSQGTSSYKINATFGSSCNVKMMFVWELVQSVYYWTVYTVVNGVFAGKYSGPLSSFSVGADSPLVLGGQTTNSDVSTFNNYWKGTVNALRVYDSAVSEDDILTMLGISSTISYELPSESTFNGSSDYIDTGLKPRLDIRTPYTIMVDFTPDTQTFADGNNTLADLYAVGNVGSGTNSHYMDILNNTNYRVFACQKNVQNITFTAGQRTKIVVKKDTNNNLTYYVKTSGPDTITGTLSSVTGSEITDNLFIGAALKSSAMSRFFKGTIHDIKVHLAEVSDDDISAYLS